MLSPAYLGVQAFAARQARREGGRKRTEGIRGRSVWTKRCQQQGAMR